MAISRQICDNREPPKSAPPRNKSREPLENVPPYCNTVEKSSAQHCVPPKRPANAGYRPKSTALPIIVVCMMYVCIHFMYVLYVYVLCSGVVVHLFLCLVVFTYSHKCITFVRVLFVEPNIVGRETPRPAHNTPATPRSASAQQNNERYRGDSKCSYYGGP